MCATSQWRAHLFISTYQVLYFMLYHPKSFVLAIDWSPFNMKPVPFPARVQFSPTIGFTGEICWRSVAGKGMKMAATNPL